MLGFGSNVKCAVLFQRMCLEIVGSEWVRSSAGLAEFLFYWCCMSSCLLDTRKNGKHKGWPSHYRAVTLTEIRPINEQVRPQKNSSWQIWGKSARSKHGTVLNSSTIHKKHCIQKLHPNHTIGQTISPKNKDHYILHDIPLLVNLSKLNSPGPRSLPSLAPYLIPIEFLGCHAFWVR